MLLHEVHRTAIGTEKTTEAKEELKEQDSIQTRILTVLSQRMKVTLPDLKKMVERHEYWMDAAEAKKIGVIDEVIGETNARS